MKQFNHRNENVAGWYEGFAYTATHNLHGMNFPPRHNCCWLIIRGIVWQTSLKLQQTDPVLMKQCYRLAVSARVSLLGENTHVFGHPLDLPRSLPPSQNSLRPRTRTLAFNIVALLSWDELFPRCDVNRYWFHCGRIESEEKLKSNSYRAKEVFVPQNEILNFKTFLYFHESSLSDSTERVHLANVWKLSLWVLATILMKNDKI